MSINIGQGIPRHRGEPLAAATHPFLTGFFRVVPGALPITIPVANIAVVVIVVGKGGWSGVFRGAAQQG